MEYGHELAFHARLRGCYSRGNDVFYPRYNYIEPPVVKPWIVQDGPYWRSRADMLRRTANDTDAFRPETRARMLQIARDFDVLAQRAEQRAKDVKTSRNNALPAPSSRRRRDRVTRAGASP